MATTELDLDYNLTISFLEYIPRMQLISLQKCIHLIPQYPRQLLSRHNPGSVCYRNDKSLRNEREIKTLLLPQHRPWKPSCYSIFPTTDTEVRLTGLWFPGVWRLPFLWMGETFATFQSIGSNSVSMEELCYWFC